MEYLYEDVGGHYATCPPPNLPTDYRKYASYHNPSFDYAERAEILIRLCKDFRVRMYLSWDTPQFQYAITSGAIIFNSSLLFDINIRCFEALASGRMLFTDDVPLIRETLGPFGYDIYYQHYSPFYQNFDLDYREIYKTVKYWLDHNVERENNSAIGKSYAWEKHSWRHRAQSIINALN